MANKLQSQSKWLEHFGVSLSPQCWCTRFGDRTAINNFERDEGSTRREKQRLVKVSQLFLCETVGSCDKHPTVSMSTRQFNFHIALRSCAFRYQSKNQNK